MMVGHLPTIPVFRVLAVCLIHRQCHISVFAQGSIYQYGRILTDAVILICSMFLWICIRHNILLSVEFLNGSDVKKEQLPRVLE